MLGGAVLHCDAYQPQSRNIAQLFLSSFNHTFNMDEIEAFLSE